MVTGMWDSRGLPHSSSHRDTLRLLFGLQNPVIVEKFNGEVYSEKMLLFMEAHSLGKSGFAVFARMTLSIYCIQHACMLSHFSCVQLFATLWTIASQVSLSMGFSRQEYWRGLPCPPPRNLPHPGIEPASPVPSALQADSLPLSQQGNLGLSACKGVKTCRPAALEATQAPLWGSLELSARAGLCTCSHN